MSSITAGTTSTTTLVHSGDTTGSLVFKTNDTGSGGTTAVTIDTSQNVGIGTSSPTSAGSRKTLTVNGASGADFYLQYGGTEVLAIQATSATAPTINYPASGSLAFQNGTERMRIDTSGNLLVGATSGGGKLSVTGTGSSGWVQNNINSGTSSTASIVFTNGNGAVGSILTSGSSTTYSTSSDYRLKNTVEPMTGALAKVIALKPVTYKWNVDDSEGEGFIAHELAEVCPHAVAGEKDAVDADGNPVYQGIDTSFLVATLTAAIQEQQALITAQAETINALTARVVALESK
jgi:hypothetical protein